jgi:uncharacterized protein with beta-barrel porin domain
VAPGNSVGTQVITGNFVQGAGGTLEIEFDNTGIDLLDISGTANLDGTIKFVELGAGVTEDTPLTFLEADGGIAGNFATQTNVFMMGTALTTALVTINATTATVTFSGTVPSSSLRSDTGAGGAVVTALSHAETADPAGTADLFTALLNSSDITAAVESSAGTLHTASMQSNESALSRAAQIVRQRFDDNDVSGMSAGNEIEGPGYTWWLEGIGGFGQLESDSYARGMSYDMWGGALGAETEFDNNIIGGIFSSWATVDADINSLPDSAESNLYNFGGYAGWRKGAWSFDGALALSYMQTETARPTSSGTALGDFDGWGGFANLRGGYEYYKDKAVTVTPFVGLDLTYIQTDGYEETGAGVQNMSFDETHSQKLSSFLGMRLDGDVPIHDSYQVRYNTSLGWAHNFGDRHGEVDAHFTTSTATSFTGKGAERNRDSARLSLDLSLSPKHDESFTAYIGYDGTMATDADDHIARIGLKWRW